MRLHKEGHLFLLISGLVMAGLNVALFSLAAVPAWLTYLVLGFSLVLYGLFVQFFRHPNRQVSVNEAGQIIAPADGKVVVIEQTQEEEYFKEARIQLSIFMSPFNVHVNRSPLSGQVSYFKYHPGKYLVAWHPKSSTENERTTLVIKPPKGPEILLRQIAGALARRIKCYVQPGQQVQQSHEFGFIKFGSRVDVFLPLDAKVMVQPNQITKGGVTVLAQLPTTA